MLVYRRIVFDDVLTGIGQVDYTSSVYDALLGTTDELALELVVDQVGASTLTLTVTAEHSGDGRNWAPLGSDVVSATLSDPVHVYVAAVTGGPALGCVRFKLTLGGSGSPEAAHVKMSVTARDRTTTSSRRAALVALPMSTSAIQGAGPARPTRRPPGPYPFGWTVVDPRARIRLPVPPKHSTVR